MWNLISVMQLGRMLREQRAMTLIDLRDKQDYERGHISRAVHMTAEQLEKDPALKDGGKEPLILICYRGPESIRTARRLSAAGYDAYAVCGGMDAWNKRSGDVDLP